MLAVPAPVTSSAAHSPLELERALLDGAALGDRDAQRAFIERYQRLVFAYLSRVLGRRAAVDDLAQEVFLRALSALPRFDPSGAAKPSTWLLTIASNLIRSHHRRPELVLLADSDVGATMPDPRIRPDEAQNAKQLREALERALSALSTEHREAFVLAEVHDLPLAEIANITDAPLGTVKARVSRAKQHLRAALGAFWEEVEP